MTMMAVAALVDGAAAYTNRRIVDMYCTTTTIAVGQSVVLNPTDTTQGAYKSVKVTAADDDPLAIGIVVALAPEVGPGMVKVQVQGPVTASDAWNPTAQGAIAINTMVGANATTNAGRIKGLGTISATVQPFAVTVKAYTDGNADGAIFIMNRFAL